MFTYDMVITPNFANGQMYFTVLTYEFLIIHFLVWRHIPLSIANIELQLCFIMSFQLKSWKLTGREDEDKER